MSSQVIVLAGIGVYLAAMLAIGIYSARRIDSSDEFVVAGRSLPLWLCTATLLATWMGAGTAMGAAGEAYKGGFLAVIADPFGAALCLFLAGLFFVRILRRLKLLTIVDFFELKYGRFAAILAALGLIVAYVGWTGSQLVAFGYLLHTLAGISTTTGIWVAAAIVLAYTTAGGMWAVALTDFVQIIILTIGFVIMLPLVVSDLGGWQAVIAQVPEHSFRMIPLEHDLPSWLHYFRAWAILGIGSLATQDLLQRAFSSKDESVAQNSAYLAGIGYLTIGLIPVMVGIVATISLPELSAPEAVVPEMALKHLHPIAMAIFVGALMAAIMSSADSALLAPASIIGSNVVPYFLPDMSPAARLAWFRYSVLVIGLVALGIALRVQTIYQLLLDSFSVTLVALIVPVTAGIWWVKANRYGAVASMLIGGAVWATAYFVFPDLPADMLGFGASALTFLLVTPLTQRMDPPKPLQDRRGNEVAMRDRLGLLGVVGDRDDRQRPV